MKKIGFILLMISFMCIGCHNSDDSPSVSNISVTGNVVDGPIAGATVTITDANSKSYTSAALTDSDGLFTVSVPSTAVFPLGIRAKGGKSGNNDFKTEYYSIVTEEKGSKIQVPVTPLSTAVYFTAKAQAGGDISKIDKTKIEASKKVVMDLFGLKLDFDPLSTSPIVTKDSSKNKESISKSVSYRTSVCLMLDSLNVKGTSEDFGKLVKVLAIDIFDSSLDGNIKNEHLALKDKIGADDAFIHKTGSILSYYNDMMTQLEVDDSKKAYIQAIAEQLNKDTGNLVDSNLITQSVSDLSHLAKPDNKVPSSFPITIIHVNDTHSHIEPFASDVLVNNVTTYVDMGGFARLASKIDHVRATKPNTLLLHAGDAVQGTLYFTKYLGQAEIDIMNRMKFDAMVIGNHEFDKGPEFLANLIKKADFPIICANIDDSSDDYLKEMIEPYVIKPIGGTRVAIIGIITPDTPDISSPGDKLKFDTPKDSVTKSIEELTKLGINKIIVLSHMGFSADKELAKNVDGIDLIVGGHSHTLLGDFSKLGKTSEGDYPTVIKNPSGENVYIVQAWEWAKVFGMLDVEFDKSGKLIKVNGNPKLLLGNTFMQKNEQGIKVTVDDTKKTEILQFLVTGNADSISENANVLAIIDGYKQGINQMQSEVAAQVTDNLLHIREPGLHTSGEILENGSYIAPVVCDAMLWKANDVGLNVDIGFQNAGGVRIDILSGNLTVGKVYELMPFGNTLYVLEVTGLELKNAIENGLTRKSGAFPYMGGARYSADSTKAEGHRLISLEILNGAGVWEPVSDTKTYRLVTNNYVAGGGDGYTVFKNASGFRYDTGFVDAEAFLDYVKYMKTIEKPQSTGLVYKTKPDEITFTLIETTDIHGSMFPYDFIEDKSINSSLVQIYTYVKQQRELAGQEVILLDNGDILQGQPIVNYFNFEKDPTQTTHIASSVMNYMKYDAATIGNHDIEVGHTLYDKLVTQFQFPWLAANALKPDKTPYFKPYTIIKRQNVSVAILGLITPHIPNWLPQSLWSGMTFDDMVESAKYWVPYIRQKEKPDLIIGLFHSGFDYTYGGQTAETPKNENASQLVAQQVAGFDLIFIGHDHIERNEIINGVLILGGKNAAQKFAKATINLTWNTYENKFDKNISGDLINVSDFEADPVMMAEFQDEIQEVKNYVSQEVGVFTSAISSRDAMFGDSSFNDLVHELQLDVVKDYLDASGADISFAAPLQYDKRIEAGKVYVRDMYKLYQYENQLYLMKMTGKEIKNYLEYNYYHWMNIMTSGDDHLIRFKSEPSYNEETSKWTYETQTRYYNYDSASGVNYTVDVTQPLGSRVNLTTMADGTDFDPNKEYKVAVNSYRGGGGGGHITTGAGIDKEELNNRLIAKTERDLRYYLMENIKKQVTVTPEVSNNWKVIPENWATSGMATDYRILYDSSVTGSSTPIELTLAGSFTTGNFDESSAEISSFDPVSKRLFLSNATAGVIDILDVSDPKNITNFKRIDIEEYGKVPNSVAVSGGIVAVAVENADKQANGKVVFFNTEGDFISQIEVGALPDMVVFTKDGKKLLVANEGEPNDTYTNDPEGSVSIIDISYGVENATVKTAYFSDFNGKVDELKAAGLRIFGPNATVAQDIEPEYITVSSDSKTAWVTLQENNALAVIDIETVVVRKILPFGFKNHSLLGNGMDVSDKDKKINILSVPVYGMYLPDSIASYQVNGHNFVVTANEGDSRVYEAFNEESKVSQLTLDEQIFPNAIDLQAETALGCLKVTKTLGDNNNDGKYEALYAFGARSFTIWQVTSEWIAPVFDSGDGFEKIISEKYPEYFNSSNSKNNFDDRSDDKGPEPEGIAIGTIDSNIFAFIALERMGGVMVYDITVPYAAKFVQYINNRIFSGDPKTGTSGDLAPEGIVFIPAKDSPNGKPMISVSNEVSSTSTLFEIDFLSSY